MKVSLQAPPLPLPLFSYVLCLKYTQLLVFVLRRYIAANEQEM